MLALSHEERLVALGAGLVFATTDAFSPLHDITGRWTTLVTLLRLRLGSREGVHMQLGVGFGPGWGAKPGEPLLPSFYADARLVLPLPSWTEAPILLALSARFLRPSPAIDHAEISLAVPLNTHPSRPLQLLLTYRRDESIWTTSGADVLLLGLQQHFSLATE